MKPAGVNAQYNVARADSIAVRVAAAARRQMFASYCRAFPPDPGQAVLDVGVTSDEDYAGSNYFEALYPFKQRITAAGLDDASFLEQRYPGLRFVCADALDLPFPDRSFDVVHSSAVIEHVGSAANQARMLAELCRVARHGVFLTTPNRWFPIEMHTLLPLVHWLPKPTFRRIVGRLRGSFFAKEENLNLLTARELAAMCAPISGYEATLGHHRTAGWPSNILLILRRRH